MDRTVQLLKALAEPTRLRIVALCRSGGDLAVSEFVRILGQSQPRVSRHLRLLTEAGALLRIPEGSWVFYRINAEGPAAGIVDALVGTVIEDDTTLARDRERFSRVKSERAATAEAYFSANADAWDEIRALHVDQTDVNAALRGLLGSGRIEAMLDIGTGTGEMLKLFGDQIGRGEGIDQSRDMLAVARSTLEVEDLGHCHVRQGDLYSLPFGDDQFDAAVIHQVLHYVDDTGGAIAEAARVLKPGAPLLIADFAAHDVEELRTQHQHRRLGFSSTEFDRYFTENGLALETIKHLEGAPLTVTIWRASKLATVEQTGIAV